MRKRFRLLLILGLTLGAALSLWVWEVRGQNAQGTTAAPPPIRNGNVRGLIS
jgi:multidrug resistance efflux pump